MSKLNLKDWFKATFDLPFTLTKIKKVLLQASSEYYNTEKRIMRDAHYDALRSFYETKAGESLPVGAAPIGNTLELAHAYQDFAGTLSKCKNIEDLKAWAKNKAVAKDELLYSIKGDGHSITVEFVESDDGESVIIDKALTRGDNGVGKDLTALFKKNVKKIPHPNVDYDCAVGYEAIITYLDFALLNKETNGKYKNPRSAIGGIFSANGQKYFKYLTIVPIRIKAKDFDLSRKAQLIIMDNMDNSELFEFKHGTLSDVISAYERHEELRTKSNSKEQVSFMYDGLVIETMNESNRKRLGYSSTEPNFATAIKFTPAEEESKVIDVKWSVEGHTARFTPVVHFEPVVIRGNTYKQVSLANYGRFKELELSVGSPVVFTLRNDTLGYIDALDQPAKLGKLLKAPTHCPTCKSKLHVESVFLECHNPNCDLVEIGNLYAFIEKSGVKNVGLEMIRTMYEHGVIGVPTDIIEYNPRSMKGIEGFGTQSANNIATEFDKVFDKPLLDYVLIGSLNIPMIGRSRAKQILEFVHYDELLLAVVGKKDSSELKKLLAGLVGIGDQIIGWLYAGLTQHEYTIKCFEEHCSIRYSKVDRPSDFVQLSFCHTGSATPMKDREDLKKFLEDKGHKLVGGVSKNTNYLINNDTTSKTGKNLKASELNVPVISVQGVMNMFADPNWE